MSEYRAIAESKNFIVLDKYTREWKVVLDLVTAPSQATIQDLSWIAGDRESVLENVRIDEHWTGVAGGSILGDGRVGLILDMEALFGKAPGE